jgi:KDO2-lipid IV(A) lauroyltransferase
VKRGKWFDWPAYVALRVVICVLQAMSLRQCQRLARGLALLTVDVLKIRGRVVDENLRYAFPECSAAQRRRLALAMWEHLLLMVAEIAHVRRKIHITNWHRYIRFQRDDEMVRFLLEDRPVMLVSGHFGNFELASYMLGMFGFATYAVARPLDNRYVDRFLHGFRGATGQYMLPKDDVATTISRLLSEGASLGVLGDQHASGKLGCWVDFFGRPAATHKAIALFSLSHGAPLIVSYARRIGPPLCYESGLWDAVDPADADFSLGSVPELTQWYTHRLEDLIRQAPGQYWWLHRRWKGKPPARQRRAA